MCGVFVVHVIMVGEGEGWGVRVVLFSVLGEETPTRERGKREVHEGVPRGEVGGSG